MGPDAVGQGRSNAATLYAERVAELRHLQTADQRQERLLGYAKLLIGFVTLVAALFFLSHTAILGVLLIPVIVFVVLEVIHENLLRSIRSRQRSIQFYERGQARLEDRWADTGEGGARFVDEQHPYARDLDLFGAASLFELLCTARTRAGEEILAKWLLNPAPVEDVVARQAAVRDLRERVKFRENLFSLGETVRSGVHSDVLAQWGESQPIFQRRTTRIVTSLFTVAWVASMVAWAIWGSGVVALAATVLSLGWAHRIHSRQEEASERLESAAGDLQLLAGVMTLLETEQFSAQKLVQIQDTLRLHGIQPSRAIGRLARIVSYLESRRNPAMRLLDVVTFWSVHLVFAAERWQQEFGPHIREWLTAVGEFEALTALSGYAFEHRGNVFPEFVDGGALFDAEGLGHPLLPDHKAVRNDVKLGDGLQLIVLSGPNMAGKSTFIRCIGVNAVLAQCGAPVRAKRLRLSSLNIAASICVLDSLSGGVSRFYAEIRRLKLADELSRGTVPLLFLLDELLSGTNSHDRLVGTELVVTSLLKHGAIGIVSTHDLALAKIPDKLGGSAVNLHFEDQLEEGRLAFDYKLKPGVVSSSNALELMRSIGLGGET
jgi:MutS domain V